MANFAQRVNSTTDIHVQSGLTAQQWADQNANGIVGDITTNAPNVCYIGLSQPPAVEQWEDSTTNEIYNGTVVEYIGSRPNDR